MHFTTYIVELVDYRHAGIRESDFARLQTSPDCQGRSLGLQNNSMQCFFQFQKENPELPITQNPMTSGPVRAITTMQTITAHDFKFAGKTNLLRIF
jgi:hypothetical protein